MSQVVLPGATIGVLGGGQLGRMMALAGRQMGYRFVCVAHREDSSCGQVCDRQITAPYDDLEAAGELAIASDVITYEFENISPDVTAMLESEGLLPQGSKLLEITRHRRVEKEAVTAAGATVAPYANVAGETTAASEKSLKKALKKIGTPSMLKTATGGYDGKGQRVIRRPREAAEALRELGGFGEFVLEKFIDFQRELSVVVSRSTTGEVKTFPVAENIHVDKILHLSIAPARVSQEIQDRASKLAVDIAENLEMVGTLAVELFLTADDEIFVNELAPRPHNSGHYTMDACWTSQFEQHIRAVCGLPLGNPRQHTPVVMANLLGQHVDRWLKECQKKPESVEVKTHLYGKGDARRNRKMGHVNVLADSVDDALAWIDEVDVWKDRVVES